MEYTLDIQLTELGFPDVLRPEDTSDGQTPTDEPSDLSAGTPRRSSRKCSAPRRLPETAPRRKPGRAEGPGGGSVDGSPGEDPPTETGDGQAAEEQPAHTDTSQEVEEVEDDSDDSEVSEMYEDDDEEDDDEEEELTNETSNSGDHRCSVCDLQLPSKFKLQDHMNLHTGARPYCCAECGKRFCQIHNYRLHLRTHAKIKAERHWCRICLTGFESQEHLKRHLSRTHFEDTFYECDLCKRVFTCLKTCERHVQLHKSVVNIACDGCGRSFPSEKSLARHRKKRCLRIFKCTDCTKTFTKKNTLLKHSFSHLGLLPYTCVRCRCHFRLAKLYRLHKCEPQRLHCVACLREFLSQEDFQQHKKDTGCWGNQEPHQRRDEIRCLECGQRFDTPEELKKHAGAHQRVLRCAECGKGFRSALLLMSHMGGHAGKSPCLCQTCGLGFPHQQNYDGHLKTCGQPSQPANVPRKSQTLKSALPGINLGKKSKPDSANVSGSVVNSPAAPAKDSGGPGVVARSLPAGSGPSHRLWSLTLDKKVPLGLNFVVFLPVGPNSGLSIPPAVSQTLPVAAVRPQPQPPASPGSNNVLLGVSAAAGASLTAPLQLSTGSAKGNAAPLDLSKKQSSSEPAGSNIPCLPVKSEPVDFEISGQANGTEIQQAQSHGSCKKITETDAEQFKMGPMAGPALHIKKEPQSPSPDPDALSSTSIQPSDRPDKEIKIEV
ncbi:unnamed protein product [Menidia menidia]|uniref:(Atlantic silverside) hypothetical protein n=1 Tax=Menidia menidia TaxID=238744 RepID=A0A8S4BNY4_9TELE|nr:unnamed protein product [Menidia menidia]